MTAQGQPNRHFNFIQVVIPALGAGYLNGSIFCIGAVSAREGGFRAHGEVLSSRCEGSDALHPTRPDPTRCAREVVIGGHG